MTTLLSVSDYGIAKYIVSGTPTASIVGAQLNDLYVDSATGINYHCVDATFGSQQWLGSDGNTVPMLITRFDHPNLLAAYTMDNISGSTLVNETGDTAYDGTIIGAVSATGLIGSSLDFNDVTDEVNFTTDFDLIPSTGNFCLSLWLSFNPPEDELNQWLLGNAVSSSDIGFLFSREDRSANSASRQIRLVIYSGGGSVESRILTLDTPDNVLPNDTSFHHLIINGDAINCTIYVDTVQVATGPYENPFTAPGTSTRNAGIGSWVGQATKRGGGKHDQWRMFNRALTTDERTALYNGGAGA